MKKGIILLSALLAACGPSSQQLAQQRAVQEQNQRAKDQLKKCYVDYPNSQRSRDNAIPFADCVSNAYNMFQKLSDIVMLWNYKRRDLAQKFHDGKIDLSEYRLQYAQYQSEMRQQLEDRAARNRLVAAQERQAKAAECIAATNRNTNSDYSGVDSTNGVVAVLSLLGAVADAFNAGQKCN